MEVIAISAGLIDRILFNFRGKLLRINYKCGWFLVNILPDVHIHPSNERQSLSVYPAAI